MPKRLDLSAILLELDAREQTEIFEIVFPDKKFRLVASKEAKGEGDRWVDFTMHQVMKPADQEIVKEHGLLLCGMGTGFDGYYKPSQIKFVDKRPEIRLKIEVGTAIENFNPITAQEYDYFKGELYDITIEPAIYINRVISVPAISSVSAATRLRLQHYHYEGAKLMARLLREGAKNPAWAIAIEVPIDDSPFEENLSNELKNHPQSVADECNLLFSDYALAQTQTHSGLIDIALSLKDGTAYRRISLMPNASTFISRVHALLSNEVFAQKLEVKEEPEDGSTFQPADDGSEGPAATGELSGDAETNPKRRGKTRKVSEDAA
jgi:hypothetical protein